MIFEKIICDRCKKEMNHPEDRKIWLSGVGREGGYDLCWGCYTSLYHWFSYPKDYVVCDIKVDKEVKNEREAESEGENE